MRVLSKGWLYGDEFPRMTENGRKEMIGVRRIYRRVTTTERIAADRADEERSRPFEGGSFRVEVIKTDGEVETTIYARDHAGRIEVEESLDGSFRLNGTASP
ncbi:MAG: hypothetical protein QUS14_11275 [Pyrinomonadaceae bacterium]|nr:hypothetical protein [Pyrinomonadaceae bacterium]